MKKTPEQTLNELLSKYNDESLKNVETKSANVDSSCHPENSKDLERFREWFLKQFHDEAANICSLEEFAIYLINAVRQQTETHLRAVYDSETPKCLTPVRVPKVAATTPAAAGGQSNLTPKRLQLAQQLSAHATAEFTKHSLNSSSLDRSLHDLAASFDQSNLTSCLQSNTSTPVRRTTPTTASISYHSQPPPHHHQQQQQRRSTGNYTANSHEKSTSRNGSNGGASTSFCLGDFLVLNATTATRSNKKQKTPQAQQHGQQYSSAATETPPPPSSKPKKRVVPTTISKSSSKVTNIGNNGNNNITAASASFPFGSSSSAFSNDNNILQISLNEIDDKNKCSIVQARKSLKMNASEISKELQSSAAPAQLKAVASSSSSEISCLEEAFAVPKNVTQSINFDSVTKPATIQCLANIYACLMDLNLTTNVLNEISFLLNLLNANSEQQTKLTISAAADSSDAGPIALLDNLINCIYFALSVLQQQSHTLASLDHKSLSVVLHNERLCTLAKNMKIYLETVQQHKQHLETQQKLLHDTSIRFDKSFKNVYYQVDKNSRELFSSNNEFGAFKTQRDLFYKVLKLWETNHLHPTWCFGTELTPRIQEIFRHCENPINMSHFAQLFVAQLLISSNDASSPEEIGLDVDWQKFSRLQQRLVAPSNFSVDYQFPRSQAFFRDFIVEARSLVFGEQLKMALYHELIKLNDSTFEQIKLKSQTQNDELEDDDDDAVLKDDARHEEYIVRPEILGSMLVLAKFLGYVTALPFSQSTSSGGTSMPSNIEKKQIILRSLFQPNFNIRQILQKAIESGKLLITLPWVVQYLAMLDNVTLQLETCTESLRLLFMLYTHLDVVQTTGIKTAIKFVQETTQLLPASIFIVRCCLGWLFETKPIIAEQYYAYRTETQALKNSCAKELTEIDRNKLAEYSAKEETVSTTTLAKAEALPELQLNAMLESLLNIACPFLAEFRVSIMPAKHALTKYVSRTGRYRHITTRLAEPIAHDTAAAAATIENTANEAVDKQNHFTPKQEQTKLIEAFLHSQNSSMRRLIEFLIERTFKSIIKDAQYKILLPSKAAADNKVNEITSNDAKFVAETVAEIYNKARQQALQEWNAQIGQCVNERIRNALDALLAVDTAAIIKQTYFLLVQRNAMQKVSRWRHENMFKNNFYCNDLSEMTEKICKANSRKERQIQLSSELEIKSGTPSVADLLDDLQYWLHCTSMRADLITHEEPIVAFLQQLPLAFVNTLPTICYRLVGGGIVQLLQHIIARHPLLLTQQLVNAACNVWLTKEMQNANQLSTKAACKEQEILDDDAAAAAARQRKLGEKYNDEKTCDDVNGDDEDDSHSKTISNAELSNIYDGLITVVFITKLNAQRTCYDKLLQLLLEMIRQNVITVDFLNVCFVPIFKEDWPSNVLNEISRILQTIAKESVGSVAGVNGSNDSDENDMHKSHLFMEVLADFSRDVEDF